MRAESAPQPIAGQYVEVPIQGTLHNRFFTQGVALGYDDIGPSGRIAATGPLDRRALQAAAPRRVSQPIRVSSGTAPSSRTGLATVALSCTPRAQASPGSRSRLSRAAIFRALIDAPRQGLIFSRSPKPKVCRTE